MTEPSLTSQGRVYVDQTDFRRACGHFPTGVAVITALHGQKGQPVGLTANSFTSAALSPPTVLWTVGPKSRSYESFLSARVYAVHVLHKGQEALASHFAGRGEDKFADLDWQAGTDGVPILPDFSVCLECAVEDVHSCGDQSLMIGRVINIRHGGHDSALMFFHSTFGQVEKP